ncbi:MAG: hypothetical protein WKF56_09930 [Candidatus Limnocylindrales bacterium]
MIRRGGARLTGLAGLIALGLNVAACSLFLPPNGVVRGGWVWPTPAPLPEGATAVALDVAPIPAQVQPDAEYGACPLALLLPFTVRHVPEDAAQPVHYRAVDDGQELRISWPSGFSARLAPDLEVVAPDGTVIASEGVPTEGLGGGVLGNDDTFSVCIGEYGPHRIEPGAT